MPARKPESHLFEHGAEPRGRGLVDRELQEAEARQARHGWRIEQPGAYRRVGPPLCGLKACPDLALQEEQRT